MYTSLLYHTYGLKGYRHKRMYFEGGVLFSRYFERNTDFAAPDADRNE